MKLKMATKIVSVYICFCLALFSGPTRIWGAEGNSQNNTTVMDGKNQRVTPYLEESASSDQTDQELPIISGAVFKDKDLSPISAATKEEIAQPEDSEREDKESYRQNSYTKSEAVSFSAAIAMGEQGVAFLEAVDVASLTERSTRNLLREFRSENRYEQAFILVENDNGTLGGFIFSSGSQADILAHPVVSKYLEEKLQEGKLLLVLHNHCDEETVQSPAPSTVDLNAALDSGEWVGNGARWVQYNSEGILDEGDDQDVYKNIMSIIKKYQAGGKGFIAPKSLREELGGLLEAIQGEEEATRVKAMKAAQNLLNSGETGIVFRSAEPVIDLTTLDLNEDTETVFELPLLDADGEPVTYRFSAEHGSLSAVDDNDKGVKICTYVPEKNYNGEDSLFIYASDPDGPEVVQEVTVTVRSVNDVPTAKNLTESITEDTDLSSAVQASDADLDPLTYVVIGDSPKGLSFNANGTYQYHPPADFNGAVTFTYQASDGQALTEIATVTITVTPVDDPPVIEYVRDSAEAIVKIIETANRVTDQAGRLCGWTRKEYTPEPEHKLIWHYDYTRTYTGTTTLIESENYDLYGGETDTFIKTVKNFNRTYDSANRATGYTQDEYGRDTANDPATEKLLTRYVYTMTYDPATGRLLTQNYDYFGEGGAFIKTVENYNRTYDSAGRVTGYTQDEYVRETADAPATERLLTRYAYTMTYDPATGRLLTQNYDYFGEGGAFIKTVKNYDRTYDTAGLVTGYTQDEYVRDSGDDPATERLLTRYIYTMTYDPATSRLVSQNYDYYGDNGVFIKTVKNFNRTYDVGGRVIGYTQEEYVRNTENDPTTEKLLMRYVYTMTYDPATGRLLTQNYDYFGEGGAFIKTVKNISRTYDFAGRVTGYTQEEYVRDTPGDPTTEKLLTRYVYTMTYDPATGRLLTQNYDYYGEGGSFIKTVKNFNRTYDLAGRVTGYTQDEYVRDTASDPTTEKLLTRYVYTMTYDPATGRLLTQNYDYYGAEGTFIKTAKNFNRTYDLAGRVTGYTQEEYVRDTASDPTTEKLLTRYVYTMTYDPTTSRLLTQSYDYYGEGGSFIKTVKNFNRTYDLAGRVTGYTQEEYVRDTPGDPTTEKLLTRYVYTMTYDPATGRLLTQNYDYYGEGGSFIKTVKNFNRTYDLAGRVTGYTQDEYVRDTASDATTEKLLTRYVYTMTYDSATGRLVSQNYDYYGEGGSFIKTIKNFNRTYDLAGRVTGYTQEEYVRDTASDPTTEKLLTRYVYTMTYDPTTSRLLTQSYDYYGEGGTFIKTIKNFNRTYDLAGRVTGYTQEEYVRDTASDPATEKLLTRYVYTMTYDSATGRLLTQSYDYFGAEGAFIKTVRNFNRTYDLAGRVTGYTQEEYVRDTASDPATEKLLTRYVYTMTYDSATGRLVSQSYDYFGAEGAFIKTVKNFNRTYDLAGRVTGYTQEEYVRDTASDPTTEKLLTRYVYTMTYDSATGRLLSQSYDYFGAEGAFIKTVKNFNRTYDLAGRVTGYTQEEYVRDTPGDPTTEKLLTRYVYTMTYDPATGRLLTQSYDYYGEGGTFIKTIKNINRTYDLAGRVTGYTQEEYVRDTPGDPTTEKLLTRYVYTMTYDSATSRLLSQSYDYYGEGGTFIKTIKNFNRTYDLAGRVTGYTQEEYVRDTASDPTTEKLLTRYVYTMTYDPTTSRLLTQSYDYYGEGGTFIKTIKNFNRTYDLAGRVTGYTQEEYVRDVANDPTTEKLLSRYVYTMTYDPTTSRLLTQSYDYYGEGGTFIKTIKNFNRTYDLAGRVTGYTQEEYVRDVANDPTTEKLLTRYVYTMTYDPTTGRLLTQNYDYYDEGGTLIRTVKTLNRAYDGAGRIVGFNREEWVDGKLVLDGIATMQYATSISGPVAQVMTNAIQIQGTVLSSKNVTIGLQAIREFTGSRNFVSATYDDGTGEKPLPDFNLESTFVNVLINIEGPDRQVALSVKLRDVYGNTLELKGSFQLDTTGPVIQAVSADKTKDPAHYELVMTVDGVEEHISAEALKALRIPSGDLTEGDNLIRIVRQDDLGNETTLDFHLTVDTQGPVIHLPEGLEGLLTKQKALLVDYTVDGVSKTKSFALDTDGAYTLTITEQDDMGNETTVDFHVTLDSTAPVISVTSAAKTIDPDQYILVFKVDGVEEQISGDALEAMRVPAGPLQTGANEIMIVRNDAAGNETSQPFTINVLSPEISALPNKPDLSISGYNSLGRSSLPGYVAYDIHDGDNFSYRYDIGAGAGATVDAIIQRSGGLTMNLGTDFIARIKRVNKDTASEGLQILHVIFQDAEGHEITRSVQLASDYETYLLSLDEEGFDSSAVTKIIFRQTYGDLSTDPILKERRGEIFVNIGGLNVSEQVSGGDYGTDSLTVFPSGANLNSGASGRIPAYVTLLPMVTGESGHYAFRYDVGTSSDAAVKISASLPDNGLMSFDQLVMIAMKNSGNNAKGMVRLTDYNGKIAEFVLTLTDTMQNFTLNLLSDLVSAEFDRSRVALFEIIVDRKLSPVRSGQIDFQLYGLDAEFSVVVGKNTESDEVKRITSFVGNANFWLSGRFKTREDPAAVVDADGTVAGVGVRFDLSHGADDMAAVTIGDPNGTLAVSNGVLVFWMQGQTLETGQTELNGPMDLTLTLTDDTDRMISVNVRVTGSIQGYSIDLRKLNPNFDYTKIKTAEIKADRDGVGRNKHAKFNLWLKGLLEELHIQA